MSMSETDVMEALDGLSRALPSADNLAARSTLRAPVVRGAAFHLRCARQRLS